MKANQAFKNDEEAVSPVIGVILMVAITVVLAAVVFVLVQNLSSGGVKAPTLGFTLNNNDKTITLIDPDAGFGAMTYGSADPDDIWYSGDCAITELNGVAIAGGEDVDGGDILLTDCAAGDSINIVHNQSGKVVYTGKFT